MKYSLIVFIFLSSNILIHAQEHNFGFVASDAINPMRASATIGYRQDLNSNFAIGGFVGLQSNSLLPTFIQMNKKDFYFKVGGEALYYRTYYRTNNGYQRVKFIGGELTYSRDAFLRFNDYFVRDGKKTFYEHAAGRRNDISLGSKFGFQKNYRWGLTTEFFFGIGVRFKNVYYLDQLVRKATLRTGASPFETLLDTLINFDFMDRQEGWRTKAYFPIGYRIGFSF